MMSLHSDWRLFLATGPLAGALAGTLYPIGLALIGDIVSRQRLGAATATFSLAFGLGSLIGPSMSGFAMTQSHNSKWLFYLPTLLSAAFAMEILVLYRKTTRRSNPTRVPG